MILTALPEKFSTSQEADGTLAESLTPRDNLS
jgi:hypothetical protein